MNGLKRVPGLSYGVSCVILNLSVLVQCLLVKDGQTDGRTDDDSIYRASIASRGKNRFVRTEQLCLAANRPFDSEIQTVD